MGVLINFIFGSGCQRSSCGRSEEIEKQLSRIEETLDDWEVAKLSVLLDIAGNECSASCSEDSDNDELCLACVKERVDPIVFGSAHYVVKFHEQNFTFSSILEMCIMFISTLQTCLQLL